MLWDQLLWSVSLKVLSTLSENSTLSCVGLLMKKGCLKSVAPGLLHSCGLMWYGGMEKVGCAYVTVGMHVTLWLVMLLNIMVSLVECPIYNNHWCLSPLMGCPLCSHWMQCMCLLPICCVPALGHIYVGWQHSVCCYKTCQLALHQSLLGCLNISWCVLGQGHPQSASASPFLVQ